MAFDNRHLRRPTGLVITLHGARARTLRLGRLATLTIFGALPLLGSIFLCATLYVLCHDQLLASLMARQSDMQYAYEDKIAALNTELDREASRGLVDRHTLSTTLHDLAVRGDQLAARAETIDALVGHGLRAPGSAVVAGKGTPDLSGTTPETSLGPLDQDTVSARTDSPRTDLRLERAGEASDKRSELVTPPSTDAVAALYDRIERAQAATVAQLRNPMIQAVARVRAALAETGLPPSRWSSGLDEANDVGGPFVPLAPGASNFDDDVALLRDAAKQQQRLDVVVDHVPLRRPLEGPLEVTSGFGARLDPFFGRPAMHTGIDLHEETGDAVEATAAGTVTIAGSEGGYGNMVEIDHGNGLATRYAHLSAIEVVPHQQVPAGFVVGRVGSTGRATGPHLHYETRINGEPVDPARFLRAAEILSPG